MDDDGFGFDDALAVGVGYGLYRHGQDSQTAEIVNALRNDSITAGLLDEEDLATEVLPAPNILDYVTDLPTDVWDDYIGQDPLKRLINIIIASAKAREVRCPHILLGSGYPGVGKTTVGRKIARMMGTKFIEVVPPFNIHALLAAVQLLNDKDVVLLDEIHKLGGRGSEILLKVLEMGVAPIDGQLIRLPDVTYIGATTEPDMLLEPVVDRFKWRPYFQAYTRPELAEIATVYGWKITNDADWLPDDLILAIADACRQTPRIIETMVDAARDVEQALGTLPTPDDLLSFLEVEPDGLTRQHIAYLTAMYQYYGRTLNDGSIEYVAGENTMMGILREKKEGLGRLERFLVERGLVNRTTRGRCLTERGITRAQEFVDAGKGVAYVA